VLKVEAARMIVAKGMSVRQTEALAARMQQEQPEKAR